MLSFQLRDEARKLLVAFEEANSFFSMLGAINSSFPKIDSYLVMIGEGGSQTSNAVNDLRSHLSSLRNVVKDINIREFYSSLEGFQQQLENTKKLNLDELSIINLISNRINIFADKYEVFISSYRAQDAAPVITESIYLFSLLNGFKATLLFFESNLEGKNHEIESLEGFSLLLPTSMNLNQFAVKLIAIDEIYNELCSLLNISTSEYPLKISKIESGSLWAKVLGNNRVVGLMVDFLNSSASYVYRNYTNEGKLTAIPRKLDAVNSVLEFKSKLEKEGIDTEEIKEHVSKAAVLIAKELNTLLDGQPEITINNKKHSVGEEIQKRLLELDRPLKLEHSELDNDERINKED